jgi:hypothetical protein
MKLFIIKFYRRLAAESLKFSANGKLIEKNSSEHQQELEANEEKNHAPYQKGATIFR